RSRYWLAKQIGVSYPTITRYYKNKTTSYENYILNGICNALDCTPADLFYYEKDEK
ncbi:MAG: helix-turn-helix transcriptional regulator, partial [Oscillospiraceae bacterium]|nr:helix-turn-helix transcriptional regulator [Oscillospiraceae bacterium]